MTPSTLTGKQLQLWREKRGWSRTYVAERIGRSHGFVWKLESYDDIIPLYAALLFAALDKNIEPLS